MYTDASVQQIDKWVVSKGILKSVAPMLTQHLRVHWQDQGFWHAASIMLKVCRLHEETGGINVAITYSCWNNAARPFRPTMG